ncbi:hypothetical protein [Staphylococcus agnetis]|uniref:hypothetical protein n=1 Tax=Staphylococcus agnetis TaxID=985762 RepID=UPI0004E320AD|nr:hypothetical protein [Staphylococcus agnetis]KFE41237.1 hypothetical protein SAGN_09005 [Staphylococcus agnetis]NJH66432.1 hypothetical protein [Staphylococcus agnetis]NJH98549.1 hypothetical protein [Staphylococcus agnetis]PTH46751.1 hypothetical protein BU587_08760 [Staphylococcus agnetis]PTH73191.1 hypothetical protein BU580_08090 [Staphylococcus agnetis]
MALLAILWGFSEATLFFIIPDVLLTFVAITYQRKRVVVKVVMSALLGALIGGACVYIASLYDDKLTLNMLLNVPSVQTYMVDHVITSMNDNPAYALITGPLFGVPYKLFAFIAPQHLNIITFLLISIPARLVRFIIVTSLAYVLSHYVFKWLQYRYKIMIWLIVWIIVYAIYFGIHGF